MQLIVAIIFVLITGPLSSHMIMKAAYIILKRLILKRLKSMKFQKT